MKCLELLEALEAYYGDKYPPAVRLELMTRYKTWGPKKLKALYILAVETFPRKFKTAPDIAELKTIEGQAIDQVDSEAEKIGPAPITRLLIETAQHGDKESRELSEKILAEMQKQFKGGGL